MNMSGTRRRKRSRVGELSVRLLTDCERGGGLGSLGEGAFVGNGAESQFH